MKAKKDSVPGKKPANNKQLSLASKAVKKAVSRPDASEKTMVKKSAGTTGIKEKLPEDIHALHNEISALKVRLDSAEEARKQVEEALHKLEQKFRTLIDNASEGIGVVQEGGYFTYYNQSFMNLSGSSEEDMRTKRFDEFIFPEDRDKMLKSYIGALKGGSPKDTFVFKLKHKDGSIRWIEANMNLIEWDGKPATLNFMTDITARKNAEDLLKKSEEQYRTVVNNAAEGITVIQDGRFKYVNPAVTEKTGYAPEELLGHRFTEVIYPEDRKLIRQSEARRERGEKLENRFTFRAINKNGRTVWVESTSVPIEWEGRPAVLSFLSDVSERQEAENALLTETIFLDSILDQSPIATWIADSSGTMVRINSACCKLFQSTEEELVGKYNIFKDTTARHQGKIPLIRDVFEKGIIARYEVTMDRLRLVDLPPDRDMLTLDVTMFPIRDAAGRVTNVATEVLDLTERKKVEKQLEESNRALQKALNDAVDTLAKIVELRDPYTSGHQRRVTTLSVKIAEEMGLGESIIANIKLAAIIHDVGKIYVPSEILSKPGKLSDIEYGIIKIHAEKGYEIVKSMDLPCGVAKAILQHHEKMDGSGYPDGLKSDQISIEAKIIAVADVVEAMSSHRPYRPARGLDSALQEIIKNRGILYDQAVVDACVRLFTEKGYKIEE